jgi:hypothetical protein
MPEFPRLLSEDEERRVLAAFLEARAGQGATEAEGQAVLEWARATRLQCALLAGILHGDCLVDIGEGAMVFGARPSEPIH